MNILITGVSGTGKTTVGRTLKARGFSVIDIDEDNLCHWEHIETGAIVDYEAILDEAFIEMHRWICNEEKLRDLFSQLPAPVFIVGMPENFQAIAKMTDRIFLLQCSPKTFLARIMQRTDNDFGKEPSAQKEITETRKAFEKEVLEMGAHIIDAEQSIEDVIEDILSFS